MKNDLNSTNWPCKVQEWWFKWSQSDLLLKRILDYMYLVLYYSSSCRMFVLETNTLIWYLFSKSSMQSLWHAFNQDLLISIRCMDWENCLRFVSSFSFSSMLVPLLWHGHAVFHYWQAFARLSAVYGGTYMLNKPQCKVQLLSKV